MEEKFVYTTKRKGAPSFSGRSLRSIAIACAMNVKAMTERVVSKQQKQRGRK